MAKSSFQFSQPLLTYSKFEMASPSLEFNENVSINLGRNIIKSSGKNEALVELTVELNKKGEEIDRDAIFNAEFRMQALFTWDDSLTEEQADKMLELNAPALLLSYIRPLIATITAASPLPEYNIPFINMVELFKEDNK